MENDDQDDALLDQIPEWVIVVATVLMIALTLAVCFN